MSLQLALDLVERNADTDWKIEAMKVIKNLALTRETFTTDDVWAKLQGNTHEPRALGAMMVKAKKLGYITSSGSFQISQRPECHNRPIAIWKSLLGGKNER